MIASRMGADLPTKPRTFSITLLRGRMAAIGVLGQGPGANPESSVLM
jgi:hypothetical protein